MTGIPFVERIPSPPAWYGRCGVSDRPLRLRPVEAVHDLGAPADGLAVAVATHRLERSHRAQDGERVPVRLEGDDAVIEPFGDDAESDADHPVPAVAGRCPEGGHPD